MQPFIDASMKVESTTRTIEIQIKDDGVPAFLEEAPEFKPFFAMIEKSVAAALEPPKKENNRIETSMNGRIGALETETEDLTLRLDKLEAASRSMNGRIGALENVVHKRIQPRIKTDALSNNAAFFSIDDEEYSA